jgi:NitT/TauT family transport system ATP-binding protein
VRVEIKGLGFSYGPATGPATKVLRRLDLTVEHGSVHAVVGPTGCGKSTLLRLIAGLEKAATGTISMLGERRRANLTAVVFQNPRLIPWWTVERNVGIGSEFTEQPPSMYKKVTDFYTRQVGLGLLKRRLPHTLSLGQQTKAALGRGLAHDAEVLLLDEPFVHLDAISRRRFHEEFETYWHLDPHTTIFVTHDVEEAVMLSDRVSVMRGGPGPLIDTVEVDTERPRSDISPADSGLRSAIASVWRALESASR